MKEYVKYIIFGVIAIIILCWITFTQIKCNKLQKELNSERIKYLEQVDSLVYINREHQRQIDTYELKIKDMQKTVDSLYKVKQKIIIKKEPGY